MIAPIALAGLISTCAPTLDARTAAALVVVESRGEPYAIADNTTKRSYFPNSFAAASALVDRLAGHQLAVGIAQVDSVNWARFGVDARDMLDPCRNLWVGSQVLADDYRRAYDRTRTASPLERRQTALRRAFSAYASGSPTSGADYAKRVVNATASPLVLRVTAIADAAAAQVPARHANSAPHMRRSAGGPIDSTSNSTVFVGSSSSTNDTAFVEDSGR